MQSSNSSQPAPDRYVVPIDPRKPWNHTGIQLRAGASYRLSVVAGLDANGAPYRDKKVPCTPAGPTGIHRFFMNSLARDATSRLNPVHYSSGHGAIQRLRVLNDRNGRWASFLTVIGAIGHDDSERNVFVIGEGGDIVAHASGELVVFSNDWPGGPGTEGEARFENSSSYANNTGALTLTCELLPG